MLPSVAVADSRHDAIIVGGRVGGALTAARLAERGMSVLVLESSHFPSATLSTHFFRGDGLVRGLAEIGVLDRVLTTGAPRLTREYFYVDGEAEPAVNPPQEPGEVGFCLSVRRETLDAVVATHVAAAPLIDFRTGTKVVDVLDEDGAITGVRDAAGAAHTAPLTVGADGRRSSVARWVEAGVDQSHAAARVMYYRYFEGWTGPGGGPVDGPEFSLLDNELAYVFPSDGGTACVALTVLLERDNEGATGTPEFFQSRLEEHRGLWPRIEAAEPLGKIFVGPPQDSVIRQAAGPGWALVGDAGTYQDPWTGFGMDTAARQAEALAEVVTPDPSEWNDAYAAVRDSVTLDRFTMTVTMAPDLRQLLAG
jgi:flavin-dependent dehydrogenase